MPGVTESLRALLANLIDYAGLYPPAALALPQVVENYRRYLEGQDAWILNRLVLPADQQKDTQLAGNWRVTLLVDTEPGPLPPQIETLEIKATRRLSLPTYCEAPLNEIADAFAKVRTGGLTPDAIPSSESIAEFLAQAAARRIAFKATAGLHHPLRSDQALTYASDSPRAVMHGFVNVFAAAAFAWNGAEQALLVDVLNDSRAADFEFYADGLRWTGHCLSTAQIADARRDFAHSFGSCSFEEPVADLRQLEWLP